MSMPEKKCCMTRENFYRWFLTLTEDAQISVSFCLAEGVYGDDCTDQMSMSDLRQHVYDIFPENNEEDN